MEVQNTPEVKEIKEIWFSGIDMAFTQEDLDDPTPMTKKQLCDLLSAAAEKSNIIQTSNIDEKRDFSRG